MDSDLPTPLHIIQDSRYAKQNGWRLDDISLCSSGNIAVSGRRSYQSYVCIYGSTVDNSDSRDKPTLLYHKQFTYKPSWRRCISFIKPNSTEIVTCRHDEVQVIDYNRDVVLRSRKVYGETRCLSVSESQIIIGLWRSDIVNIYDNDLNRIKSIRLKGIRYNDWPRDVAAAADRLYVCADGYGRAIVYSQDSGSILTEYTTGQRGSKAWSMGVCIQLGLTAVLWYHQRDTDQKQIILYPLSKNKSFLTVNVESGVSRIRISEQGRIVTGNEDTGEVKIYRPNWLHKLVTYDTVKRWWQAVLQKDDCRRLTDHFHLPKDQTDAILMSDTPTNDLLLALEEREIIYPSNVSRLINAFVALQMSETYYKAANIYQENASATSYERFLVTLSAHLTASVVGDLCSHFNIPHYKKSNITSNQNPGLSLLLALDKMGIINQSRVLTLEQPFTNLRLVQAVAKIQEYQSLIEDDRALFQHTTGLTKEEKRNLFLKLLQKKIMSWYEAMTPVPWKKSCQWKSSELFVESGLILTNSKTQRSLKDVDDKCKLNYTEIFSHKSLREETRIIIEGEPGSGKTMLSSQLAYDWSQGKISDVTILILLPLKFVQTRTLVEATEEFYLMEDKGLSLIDIEDVIIGEGGKCCFLLDGLEEYSGQDETSAEEISEVVKVMTKVKYPNCKVILTSRSDYAQDLPSCPMLKLGTFGEVERQSYIEKVYSDDHEKHMKVKDIIDETPFILDLCSVPLLFVLAVHNIGSIANIQDVCKERVSPFIGMVVETLCPSEQSKYRVGVTQRYDDDCRYTQHGEEFYAHETYQNRSQDISLEMLAFNGLCRGKQQLSWQKRFVEENVRTMKQYLDSGILVVEEAVNVGMDVVRTAKENADTEQIEGVWSELNENAPVAWNISRQRDSDSGKTVITQREPFKEAFQELQKDNVDTAFNQWERFENTTCKDRSNYEKTTIPEENEPRDYLKTPLTVQHVSLQVKFLHKVLQEWFAARYLADICWKYGELALPNKYKFFREHLQQINPADLHYVLRFTCALCPPSCHLILNYLLSTFRSEEGKIPGHIVSCICLCLAEYDGYKGHYIKDVISEVCKADITIHPEDSRLLQRTKVSMLQLASNCKFPISRLQLVDVIIEAKGDELIFNSGTSLKMLNTLQRIEMRRWDHTLSEGDYANIVKFVLNSASVKVAFLFFPIPPPTLEPDILEEVAGREVTVDWHIGRLVQTLDLSKGLWQVQVKGHNRQTIETSVNANQDWKSLLETKAVITKNGGVLEIPNTGVMLIIPPNALPEYMKHCEIHMRIIPWETVKEKATSFASNSSTAVELLPDRLKFQHPVRLTLPHCLVLQDTRERKAKIFISHHEKESLPEWEEQAHLSYHLEDTACIILLDSLCWVKFSVDDEIVKAKKLIVYTAGRKLQPQDSVAEIRVGYYLDLPDEKMVESDARDLSVGHRKTFFFVRRKEKFPLEVSLDKIFPDDWQYHSKKPLLRKVPYEQISSFSRHSLIYTLKKETSMDGNLLCVFTVSQEKGQISVQLAAHLKLIENNLPAGHTPSGPNFWEQSGASMKVEMTVTKAGETLTISDSGVKLEVPPNAIPTHMEQCRIQMKITPSRVVEDQVTSFCSNSCTAVEISPCNLSLHCPARLTLPHCLTFKKKKDCKARIFINEEEGSPSPWLEKQDLEYELNDSVCIMHLEKLCCVKYSIDDDGVKAKRIILYTAAKSLKQYDALAEVEVGYYSDIPGGRELLQLNPKLEVDSETELLFMEKQKLALELLLDCVIPLQWKCRMPNENPQEIPYKVIASSIEHSHLYVLQKENDQPGSVICQFIASQKDSPLSSEISLRLYPQEHHHEGIAQNHQMKPNTYSMTDTFQLLAKKLTDEWKSLGRKLHLDDADIYRIETDCKSTEEAIYQMLQCWKKKEGSSATYAVLVTALEEVNRKDLAEKVRNLKDVFEEA